MKTDYSNIIASVNFLASLLQQRLDIFFGKTESAATSFPSLSLYNDNSLFYQLFERKDVTTEEKVIFLTALMPHVQPNFYDNIIQPYLPQGGDFAEIGGVKGASQRSMLPTGETVQFILAGNNIEKRLGIQQQLLDNSSLIKEGIIQLEKVKEGEPLMSGKIMLGEEYINAFINGADTEIKFGPDFPAKRITTKMQWEDAVLNHTTFSQINDIMIWMQHNEKLLEDEVMKRKIKPGYRVLFYGPSGTGKTLTATLLGNHFNRDVYRIDLSQVVSKYIGETEKNLEKVFSKAEHKNWILFFDEADALFGKRTSVQNSHDRYANQEVSYLLQRIEDFPGLLILASNFKNNIDSAFVRRFHTTIYFPMPDNKERLLLWEKSMPESIKIDPEFELTDIAGKYELTGAGILNVMHYAMLKTIAANDAFIRQKNIVEGIKRELRKTERTVA
ncbi:ATP-binding protein [Parafilimonas sp.]|uniref:ATP-binding protein n=1 Tax=Parafilimonas sp. TaxID=1969739 RepID=UPI0039E3C805